jgi:hypothetical protein
MKPADQKTGTPRSLTGFRQNTLVRVRNKGTFRLLHCEKRSVHGESCKKHISFALGVSWKLLRSQKTTQNFWKSATRSSHTSQHFDHQGARLSILRHSASKKLSTLTEHKTWIPCSKHVTTELYQTILCIHSTSAWSFSVALTGLPRGHFNSPGQNFSRATCATHHHPLVYS